MRNLLLIALLLTHNTAFSAHFQVGDRIWVSLYADNVVDDGYAIGFIEKIEDNGDLFVAINKFEPGKGRTLAGTCHPGGVTAMAGAEIIENNVENLRIEQTLKPSDVKPYKQGWHEFLLRENLATVLQRWFSNSFGQSSFMLRNNANTAQSLNIPAMAKAFELMAIAQDANSNGIGFPSHITERALLLADAITRIQLILNDDATTYTDVLEYEQIKALGATPDYPAQVIWHFLEMIQQDILELDRIYGDYANAQKQLPALNNLYPNILRLLTKNGTHNFDGKDQQYWLHVGALAWAKHML